ncbi:ABC transporter permease subunit [Paenibacillus sp. LMG 31461]|uniref:ABC transporter permease subunit n=1 Tax=Paenibacillus plantarum TaxID=2654975 RepID=A0ABX1X276_9BACL|nr:carbohydrate ABC transporter permease [Paenibacillus plantarum]NOU62501.1 ABC transporter permease subunit [Paenibacillus plantarum]
MFEKTWGFRLFFWSTLILIGLFIMFPLYWMLNTALKPAAETLVPTLVPSHPTLSNFWKVIQDPQLRQYVKNSLFTAGVSSILATFISAYAGFSFSKFRYRGRKSFMSAIMISKMFPYGVLLLSIYILMQRYGLLDSYTSLILAFVTFTLPVGTWTLKTYFDEIPDEVLESAKMDGAGWMLIIHRIIFPLALPGLVSVAIFGFVLSWNDLLYSLTLVTDPAKRTLAPGLVMKYIGESSSDYGGMMAASIMVSVPVTMIFLVLQRFFIKGLTAGAVKG